MNGRRWGLGLMVALQGCNGCGVDILGTAHAKLALKQESLDFGTLHKDEVRTLPLEIENTGDTSVLINDFTFSANEGYTLDAFTPQPVDPGTTTTLQVTFRPVGQGHHEATLSLGNSGDKTRLEARLVGERAPTVLVELTPPSLVFPSVVVGGSATMTLQVGSVGEAALTLSGYEFTGDPVFSLGGLNLAAIAPGTSRSLDVVCTPVSALQASGTLTLRNNSDNLPSASVTLSCHRASQRELTINPMSLDFGEVTVGGFLTLPIAVRNTGEMVVTMQAPQMGGDPAFSLSSFDTSTPIAVDETRVLELRFTPTAVGAVSGSVLINNDSANVPAASLALQGRGK